SDARAHTNPTVTGFNVLEGSAPDEYFVNATGGPFCLDDLGLTLQVSGSSNPTCYKLSVIPNKGTDVCQTGSTRTCTITQGSGAYTDGSMIYIVVEKTCGTNVTENVAYTVTGHL